jgi:hypothetical protein
VRGVLTAVKDARDTGILVIALDTATESPDAVDATFATDNLAASWQRGAYVKVAQRHRAHVAAGRLGQLGPPGSPGRPPQTCPDRPGGSPTEGDHTHELPRYSATVAAIACTTATAPAGSAAPNVWPNDTNFVCVRSPCLSEQPSVNAE